MFYQIENPDSFASLQSAMKIDVRASRKTRGWIVGSIKVGTRKFAVSVLAFDEPSDYGIDCGRVSKLQIRDAETRRTVVSYDRGWDVRPTDADAVVAYNRIMVALPGVAE